MLIAWASTMTSSKMKELMCVICHVMIWSYYADLFNALVFSVYFNFYIDRLYIYELSPSSERDLSSCFKLGGIYNPLNITQNPTLPTTDDKYMVGNSIISE